MYHARSFKYSWFFELHGRISYYPKVLYRTWREREREDSAIFYRKNKTKTPNPKKHWNYKDFTTFLCIIKEYSCLNVLDQMKGTDFQTPSKLTPALNITPISRAHFQVPKLKSSPCHSLLVKSTIFVSIIGFLLRCEFFSLLSQLFNRRLVVDSLIFRWFLSPCLVQWFCYHWGPPGKRDASPH